MDVPGPVVDRLAGIASEAALYLVIGVVERDGGTLYCTVLFFSPDGYLGKHRKLMPTAAERLVWGFRDGSTMPVFGTSLGRIGAVICWENYMPLLRMAMYAKGVQIYCAPTADGRDTWLSTMRHVALEGRYFVLSCNQFTRRSDFPDDIPNTLAQAPDDVLSTGGSCIISPLGEVLAGPARDGEETLFAIAPSSRMRPGMISARRVLTTQALNRRFPSPSLCRRVDRPTPSDSRTAARSSTSDSPRLQASNDGPVPSAA